MTSPVEAEGNSIDEAIAKALEILGVGRDRAQVEILQDARRSVLGFGGQRARVRAKIREAFTVEEPAPHGSEENSSGKAGDAAAVLREILRLMDFAAQVEEGSSEIEGQTELKISSESSGLVIGRHGQTLDALEYLVNRIASRQEERAGRIGVDCEGYRERRNRELQQTASRLAEKVRQRGKPQTMVLMSPRDRRIVHMALSADAGVVTRSLGQGYLRRIVISPARESRESQGD